MVGRNLAAAAALAALIAVALVTPGGAAEPAAAASVTVVGPAHAPVVLAAAELARLPAQPVTVSFATEHGTRHAAFDGPLLWAVLEKTGAIDPAKPRGQVSQIVVITGRDGYRAVLALAEIAPEFEAKPVILADRMDGKPLGPEHLRVVVPLDKRGGRSVRDVVRIEVRAAPP